VLNEGYIANFAPNWLPWQRLLRNKKTGPDWQHSHKYIWWKKNPENRSSGSWELCSI